MLDLQGGVAVHAVRGEREDYAPVRSVLAGSAEPVALARAFRTALGCRECYVADLDAIAGRGDHGTTIRAIAELGMVVWLDAGNATPREAERALGQGAGRVIVGSETLRHPDDLPGIVAAVASATTPHAPDCVLSLDLRQGRLLGGSPAVRQLSPLRLAELAWEAGIRAFIVLDLARVGAGGGVDTQMAHRLRQGLPAAEIIVGGGLRDEADLAEMTRQGFDGVLVATALHTGAIRVK
ncbi:MAG TPA: HisA/HisF-related TIM barrel protein [Candidatus Methylomirabilis sp.]|nr:HisA/HisF-related TIM barrel protein [Candidatus Methylomirabilis sp.]